jgi:ABC-type antimicrobial peptide transport system permease subunit
LGKRLRWLGSTNWATVIGVAPNLCVQGILQTAAAAGYYLCQNQQPTGAMCVMVRTQGDPQAFLPSLRQIISALAPDQPLYSARTLAQAVSEETSEPNALVAIFALFGGLAVFLAAFGIYSVVAFSVAQRTREFGIRFALGAQAGEVLRLVLWQGIRYVVIGLVIGVVFAFGLSKPLSVMFYNVSTSNPWSYGLVMVMMVHITLLAMWVPARRATKVDPMDCLRYE